MTSRLFAKVTGWSLILMAVVAAFAFGYALPLFSDGADHQAIYNNLQAQLPLYRNMLLAIGLILLLDLLISYTLYGFFRQNNKTWALSAMVLRLAYTAIFAIATYHLTKNLSVSDGSEVGANILAFNELWSFGLIVFGFHLLFIGLLMRAHGRIHSALWVLALLAGFSYVLVHFLKVALPQAEFTSTLEMVLSLPMAVGELALAVWLLVRGGRD